MVVATLSAILSYLRPLFVRFNQVVFYLVFLTRCSRVTALCHIYALLIESLFKCVLFVLCSLLLAECDKSKKYFSRLFQQRMAWFTFTKHEGVQQQISFYESKCLRKPLLKATIQCTHALMVFIFPLINVLDGHLLCNIQMGLIEFPLDKYSGFSLLFSK